ncbi:MAG: hypothetical protein LBS20_09635 [Prevotella sp.]|jgi:hypothetical protein|nr:hypothetical protein [Prevotella sp.]
MKYPVCEEIEEVMTDEMKEWRGWTMSDNQERGFAIYLYSPYDNDTKRIYSGNEASSETFQCPTSGRLFLTTTFDTSELRQNPTESDGYYLIAIFHTHPSISGCDENVTTILGPSKIDETNYTSLFPVVPAFVYDYDDNGETKKEIHGGYPRNSSSKIYHYGVNRRDYELDTYDGDYDE